MSLTDALLSACQRVVGGVSLAMTARVSATETESVELLKALDPANSESSCYWASDESKPWVAARGRGRDDLRSKSGFSRFSRGRHGARALVLVLAGESRSYALCQ